MPARARARIGPQHGRMQGPDIDRRIENLVTLGTIASVDYATARVRVEAGGMMTAPLPWLTARAGNARTWWPPSVGEQVLLLCPGGDPARGVVLPGIYTTASPAPADGEKLHHTAYPDGAVVSYDAEAHQLTATLPAGGKADVTAPGGVHITGDTLITGKLHVTDTVQLDADAHCSATVTADTDVKGGGKSLKTHGHTGVTPGSGNSGPPA